MTSIALAMLFAVVAQVQNEVPVLWTGSNSKVTKAELKLITTQDAWVRTWLENTGDRSAIRELDERLKKKQDLQSFTRKKGIPEVNFKNQVVLAIFGGRARPAYGYWLHSTHREADTFVLWIQSVGARTPNEPARAEYAKPGNVAYGFFLLPRNFRRVSVLDGVFEGVWAGANSLGTLELKDQTPN
jgi:hypothetical protein